MSSPPGTERAQSWPRASPTHVPFFCLASIYSFYPGASVHGTWKGEETMEGALLIEWLLGQSGRMTGCGDGGG